MGQGSQNGGEGQGLSRARIVVGVGAHGGQNGE